MAGTSPAMTAQGAVFSAVPLASAGLIVAQPARATLSGLAAWQEEPPRDLDDDQRYESAEQHVAEVVAAEG
jgi:hypothetical protein